MIRVDRGAFSSDASEDGLNLSDEVISRRKSASKQRFAVSPTMHPSPKPSLANILNGRSDMFSDGPSAVVGQSINGIYNKRPSSNARTSKATAYKRFSTPPAPNAGYPSVQDRDLSETLNRLSGENYELRAELKIVKKRCAQLEKELGYTNERKVYYKKAAVDAHAEAQKNYETTVAQKTRLEDLELKLQDALGRESEYKAQLESAIAAKDVLQKQLEAANETNAILKKQNELLEQQVAAGTSVEKELKSRNDMSEKRVSDLEGQVAFLEKIYTARTDSAGSATVSRPESHDPASVDANYTPPTVLEVSSPPSRELDAEIMQKKTAVSEASEQLKALEIKIHEKMAEVDVVSQLLVKLIQAVPTRSEEVTRSVEGSQSKEVPEVPRPKEVPQPKEVASPTPLRNASSSPVHSGKPVKLGASEAPTAACVVLDSTSQELMGSLKEELVSLPARISKVLEARQLGNDDLFDRLKDFLIEYAKVPSQRERLSGPPPDSPSVRRRHSSDTHFDRGDRAYRSGVEFVNTPDMGAQRRVRSISRMESTHSLQPEAFVAENAVPGLSEDSTTETVETIVGDNHQGVYNTKILAELKRQLNEQNHPHKADALRFAANHLNGRV